MSEAGILAAPRLPSPSATFLIQVLPRSFDIWAFDQVAELVGETRETLNPEMRACIFLNAPDAQGHDNEDSAMLLKDAKASSF